MRSFLLLLAFVAGLVGCAADQGLLIGESLRRNNWPLLVNGTASVTTANRTLRYYWICQTPQVPSVVERSGVWKLNFYTFTKHRTDFFDGETLTLTRGMAVQQDENGGWLLATRVIDEVSGDYGITSRGHIFIDRDLVQAKLGPGQIHCICKMPNPDGAPEKDRAFTIDMTEFGLPLADVPVSGLVARE